MYDTVAREATTFSHGHRADLSHTIRTGMDSKVSEVARKLKELRTRARLTVQAVADALGMRKSTYAAYEDKFKKPAIPVELAKRLVAILTPHGVERGEVLSLAGITDAFEPSVVRSNHVAKDKGMAEIDELDAVGAGPGTTVEELEPIRRWTVPRNVVSIATEAPLERIKIVRVKGDSMIPTYNPLDRLMVDTEDTRPSPGGVFVVWDGLGLVIKRVQVVPHSEPLRVKISSDNPKYDPYDRVLGEAYIQGRVIGKWMWT